MVANAHQDQDPEVRKIYDGGYLVGVVGLSAFCVCIPLVKLTAPNEIPITELCMGNISTQEPVLLLVIVAVFALSFLFTALISLRTRKNLRKLKDQDLKKLPANNALTYLDRQIVCFLLFFFILLIICSVFLFRIDVLTFKVNFIVSNLVHMCLFNIVICFMFPVYIILKTRRYLPRLWDGEAPLILQNNDFYTARWSQVSPQQETAQSGL